MNSTLVIIGAAGIFIPAMLALIYWVSKHIANSKKHPCKDDIVFKDVCEERGKTNEIEHCHLKEGIEAAIAKSDQQHGELKQDVKDGFSAIQSLIKNGA